VCYFAALHGFGDVASFLAGLMPSTVEGPVYIYQVENMLHDARNSMLFIYFQWSVKFLLHAKYLIEFWFAFQIQYFLSSNTNGVYT